MPYADPEKRRQYHRDYNRRRRGLIGPDNPLAGFRVYLCFQYPNLTLSDSKAGRSVSFYNGFVVTDDPEDQAIIENESHGYFKKYIWPLALATR